MSKWIYYNHALKPDLAPSETVDEADINKAGFWKMRGGGISLFASWVTDFDSDRETAWWYCIKDTPYDISALKAKRRYEINKGLKNFTVEIINPTKYKRELFAINVEAYKSYPPQYRPKINEDIFYEGIKHWEFDVFGAFEKNTGELRGYALLKKHKVNIDFGTLRVMPEYEKQGINAALVASVCEYYNDDIKNGMYLNDGSRPIIHETNFQEYLEKYFGFRKAYCKLHVCYRFPVGLAVRILYPVRNIIRTKNPTLNRMKSLLKMEEYKRKSCK